MRGMRMDNGFPEQRHVDLIDDVSKLQIAYSHTRPGTGTCFIEDAGRRIKVYEVDRFLLEHLLEHLKHREA